MRELDLRMFDSTYQPVCKGDSGVNSVSMDKQSYQAGETIKITANFKSGYKLESVLQVLPNYVSRQGTLNGITAAPVSYQYIIVQTKADYSGEYIVREPVMIDINGKREYIPQTARIRFNNGEMSWNSGKAKKTIEMNDAVKSLIAQEILIPVNTSKIYNMEITK